MAPPGRDERDPGRPKVLHEHPTLCAIRVEGHVQRIAVVEAHTIVKGSLTEGADRQGPAEAPDRTAGAGFRGQRPGPDAVVTGQARRLLERPRLDRLRSTQGRQGGRILKKLAILKRKERVDS